MFDLSPIAKNGPVGRSEERMTPRATSRLVGHGSAWCTLEAVICIYWPCLTGSGLAGDWFYVEINSLSSHELIVDQRRPRCVDYTNNVKKLCRVMYTSLWKMSNFPRFPPPFFPQRRDENRIRHTRVCSNEYLVPGYIVWAYNFTRYQVPW